MIKHLACIMDGNRRWALKQGLSTLLGHKKGFDSVDTVINFCLAQKIAYLSLYVFSIENLQKRSIQEQYYLFQVLANQLFSEYFDIFKQKNILIKFIGDRSLFPKDVRVLCEKIEKETAHATGLQINFLLCYGSQQEIVDTAKRIAIKVKKGDLAEHDITTELFNCFLWTADIPLPDLIIRTGGKQRMSNFFLYQAAYSELYFLDCLWPDISEQDLHKAVTYFNNCQQNFGQ